jgi:hypothetical protein
MNDATLHPDPSTVTDPLIPHDLAGWFDRADGIVRRSFRPLLAIMTVSAVISAVHGLTAIPTPPPEPGTDFADQVFAQPVPYLVAVLSYLVLLLVTSFLQAMAVYMAVRDADGRPTTFGEAARYAAGLAAPLLAWWLVAGLLVLVGSFFLLVPGIYLGVVLLSTVTMVVLVERRGIGRCFALIKGRFWATFGRMLLLTVLTVAYLALTSLITHAVTGDLLGDVALVLLEILTIPLGIVLTAFLIVTYTELRGHENAAVTTSQLTAEMSR